MQTALPSSVRCRKGVWGGTVPVRFPRRRRNPVSRGRLRAAASLCTRWQLSLRVSRRHENALDWRENSACRAGRAAAVSWGSGHRCFPRRCSSRVPKLHLDLVNSGHVVTLRVPLWCCGRFGRVVLIFRLADPGPCGVLLPADYSHHHRLRG